MVIKIRMISNQVSSSSGLEMLSIKIKSKPKARENIGKLEKLKMVAYTTILVLKDGNHEEVYKDITKTMFILIKKLLYLYAII